MKIFFISFFVIASILSCKTKNDKMVRKTETKLYGDSLKIVYTYIGDTVFQKRTDLKGKVDDGLDNSFDVRSIWLTIEMPKLDCDKKITFTRDSLDFTFCFKDVLSQTKKEFRKRTEIKWANDSVFDLKTELLEMQNGNLNSVSSTNYYMLFYFIKNLESEIFDRTTNTEVSKIRMENYETNFSGGNIFYLINKQKDTVSRYNLSDWSK